MRSFDYVQADSASQALDLIRAGAPAGARFIAGGTDLVTLMRGGQAAPTQLIDIKPARALRYVRFEEGGELRIGGLATLADLERDADVGSRLPILVQAVRDAATPQLRAMATVGGNLLQRNRCWYFRSGAHCWLKGGPQCFAREGENRQHAIFDQSPCVAAHPSDLAPALLALDAQVAVQGREGTRTVAVGELLAPPTEDRRVEHHVAQTELISEIRVPAQPEGAAGVYLKAMDRRAWAFALASAAAQVTMREGRVHQARLVLGGVANVPWLVREADSQLRDQQMTPELAASVAEAAVAEATPLEHNGYKVPLARELARRALLLAAGVEP